jgi:hypothetical protein
MNRARWCEVVGHAESDFKGKCGQCGKIIALLEDCVVDTLRNYGRESALRFAIHNHLVPRPDAAWQQHCAERAA